MLSSAQRDEFDRRGILRLPATIPSAEVTAMRQRVWEHLLDKHAIRPDRPETWTVQLPAQFQKLTGTGAFDAMATDQLCAVIDDLLGAGRWQRPAHWGRPLVTFPRPDTGWDVPASGWHLDSHGDLDELTMVVVFAHLAPVRPRGGGTLVITGSHRLTRPAGAQADNAPVRSAEVKAHLRTLDPWLRGLWKTGGDTNRIRCYLEVGAVVDGVQVRVEELTGEPGDAVIMHPRLLHVMAPNALHVPRMMLLQFLHLKLRANSGQAETRGDLSQVRACQWNRQRPSWHWTGSCGSA
jgi:ectoine hydroxylase-related dioxygenase (phytanoyl-CoA dioxygenase family)